MPVKDYYKILELPPNAGHDDVKKNFRRLAIRFHPDTNTGHKHGEAWYREIQEAYQVLTDPAKKSKYLQDRWLLKSRGLPFDETFPLTPEFIEKRFRAFRISVSRMDHFRMDHATLQHQIFQIANDETLDALTVYQDHQRNKQIIGHLLYCMAPLEYPFLAKLEPLLQKIAGSHPDLQQLIRNWYLSRKRQHFWEKRQGWFIAGMTLFLCLLIAFLTRIS